MAAFHIGETVICSVEVREDGVLKSPATSMQIEITGPSVVVTLTSMGAPDSVGKYHYDFPTATQSPGPYKVKFVATDSTRVSIGIDTFTLQ